MRVRILSQWNKSPDELVNVDESDPENGADGEGATKRIVVEHRKMRSSTSRPSNVKTQRGRLAFAQYWAVINLGLLIL